MANERDSNGCPHSESALESVQRYARLRQETMSSDDLVPLFTAAGQVAQTVFNESLEMPEAKKERPFILDDSGTLIIRPGSLSFPAHLETEMFLHSAYSSTHNLLHREKNRECVANLLEDISHTIPLFSKNVEEILIDEIKSSYKPKDDDNPDQKHTSMLRETSQAIRENYGVRVYRGIIAHGETLQPVEDFVTLRDALIEIESNEDASFHEASIIDAYFAVNDKKPTDTFENGSSFIFAGIHEGVKVSVATIDGMRSAVREWNKTHPEKAVDFYQFAKTEGKKWISLMATGHLSSTFELLRGLCGDSYSSDFPTFPPGTLGLGTYNETIKMGFRISKLNKEQLFYLQTMYTAYTAGAPRTKCPALGNLAEELYSNILTMYEQCMS